MRCLPSAIHSEKEEKTSYSKREQKCAQFIEICRFVSGCLGAKGEISLRSYHSFSYFINEDSFIFNAQCLFPLTYFPFVKYSEVS